MFQTERLFERNKHIDRIIRSQQIIMWVLQCTAEMENNSLA